MTLSEVREKLEVIEDMVGELHSHLHDNDWSDLKTDLYEIADILRYWIDDMLWTPEEE